MRKKIGIILIVAVVLSFASGVIAKNVYESIKAEIRPDFVIEIDGKEREFRDVDGDRVYPILHNGTTYLPIRAIGEIMGKDVYWYEAEKRIELKDKEDGKTTVTDADVIIDSNEKNDNNKDKNKIKPDKDDSIGEESVKKIALDKAGFNESEVNFIKVKLEKDDGIYKYDVEFRKGLTEYNAEIKADDGTILEWDVDFGD